MTASISERIVFIKPGTGTEKFSYDFAPLAREAKEMRERIKTATSTSFDYISAFFSALASASYRLVCSILPSFTYSVLGLGSNEVGLPGSIEALFFKTIVWTASLTFSFVLSVYNHFSQNLGWDVKENQEILMSLSKTLDSRHFKTKEFTLDTSNVPAKVTVNSLLEMFDQINFDNPNLPGYMAPASRIEERTTYTIQQLKTHLTRFVSYTTSRTPFIGTPPAGNILALMKFYQQIEDAVRLSIHKSDEDLRVFQERSGANVTSYEGPVLNEYKNLLEDRSRLVIDIAIAGAHCGARYMGDSMSVYANFYGSGTQNQQTLEDSLIETLAQKRKQIVESMIRGNDTHAYAEHMALLGEILGLPGTSGVVEHLSRTLNKIDTLKKFFTLYTEDTIIESINEKWQDVKKGGAFRHQIYDWLTNLISDWNKEKYAKFLESEEIQTFQAELESLKNKETDVSTELNRLNLLCDLIAALRPHLTEEVSADNWNGFLDTLLAKEDDKNNPMFGAKKAFRDAVANLAGSNPIETRKILETIKTTFSTSSLNQELASSLISFTNSQKSSSEFNTAPFIELFSKQKKQSEIIRLFKSLETTPASTTAAAEEIPESKRALSNAHIEADSVLRFLDGTLAAKELIENSYEKVRKAEFIEKFQVDGNQDSGDHRYENLTRKKSVQKMENNHPVFDAAEPPVYKEVIIYEPLPAALIEVLLVSHKIFLPQSITNGGI